MGNNEETDGNSESANGERPETDAAYRAWLVGRVDWQDKTIGFFHQTYLGRYASLQHYAQELLDRYGLGTRLDTAIEQPYRRFLGFDLPGFARYLLDSDQIYTIDATPAGFWIFNGEID